MREIKFRAWDKFDAMMLPWESLTATDQDGRSPILGLVDLNSTEQFEWLQYTGLKDKNGVEIYEGDILWGNYDPGKICFQVVTWIIKDEYRTYGHGDHGTDRVSGFNLCGYYSDPDKWQVIGNIYQNPELLK